ncbi:MAG: ATP-binding protein [Candidatus Binatia bacterium]
MIIDSDGNVVVYNPPAEWLLGLPAGSLHIGEPLPNAPELAALVELVAQLAADRSETFSGRLLPTMNGRLLEVGALRVPAASDAGDDILLTLHDAPEVERLDAMRRDFAASLSHEVRTPLAAIQACSATLLGGALADARRARRFVEMIEQHVQRLARLVDDLGRLSELEQGGIDVRRRAVAVEPILRAAVDACRDRARAAEVTIDLAVAGDTPDANADRDLLLQAMVRLIDNAISFTPHGGRVSVSAAAEAGGASGQRLEWLQFCVADTGIGVPPSDMDRLSERFFRVDKARSRERGGSGLGLALVKHIARAHGAIMRIQSEVDQGTSVSLFWPACDAAAQPAGHRVAAQ